MVIDLLRFFKDVTVSYWGDCTFGVLFFIALIVIFVLEKDQIKKIPFFWFAGIALIFIYNPVTYIACRRFFYANNFMGYYLKLYNLLPVVFMIAFGFTLFACKFKGWVRFGIVVVTCAIMVFCGTTVQRQSWFTRADNYENVPKDVTELCDLLAEELNAVSADGDEIEGWVPADCGVHIMAPTNIATYLRQVDSRFFQIYGREDVDGIHLELISEKPDWDKIYDYAIANDMDYVVTLKWNEDGPKDTDHFERFGETTNYDVYKVNMPEWVLTQCRDASGDQGLCYFIRNTIDNRIIIIDGGATVNSRWLYEDVTMYGGKVDAWIITHYHSDHVGAFNDFVKNYPEVEIKAIYDSPLDYDYFTSRAFEWDEVEYYGEYLELTDGMDNVHHVIRGEEISFDDLKIKFLNTYDELTVECGSDDIANNCALVCKVYSDNGSALIMSDCHSEAMGELLMKLYLEDLKAEVLSAPHHGNNAIPSETGFYEIVAPKRALFDAPDWLMEGEKYSAKDLKEYLEGKGIEVDWYDMGRHGYGL